MGQRGSRSPDACDFRPTIVVCKASYPAQIPVSPSGDESLQLDTPNLPNLSAQRAELKFN